MIKKSYVLKLNNSLCSNSYKDLIFFDFLYRLSKEFKKEIIKKDDIGFSRPLVHLSVNECLVDASRRYNYGVFVPVRIYSKSLDKIKETKSLLEKKTDSRLMELPEYNFKFSSEGRFEGFISQEGVARKLISINLFFSENPLSKRDADKILSHRINKN